MKTNDWKPYNPKQKMQLYNIFTKSGRIYASCYFKDGSFIVTEPITTKGFDGSVRSVDVVATQEVEDT